MWCVWKVWDGKAHVMEEAQHIYIYIDNLYMYVCVCDIYFCIYLYIYM